MAATITADAYEVLAPAYDTIVADYDYERWLGAIEDIAWSHGLRGRRVLDVACGTGSSFLPLLDRGYEVTGCDLSPAMIHRAREHLDDRDADLHVADMRDLPDLGRFDLVVCLDDSINHLLAPGDVDLALAGMARSLAPGGLLVFDVNTLSTLRSVFAAEWTWEDEHRTISWSGLGPPDLPAGGRTTARLTVSESGASEETLIHERHHPLGRLVAQIRTAGLHLVAIYGQRRGVRLSPSAEEERDDKALLFARA